MLPPIKQSLRLPSTAKRLYSLYMNPKLHAAFTGVGPVKISPKPNSPFKAFDGQLWGRTLLTIPNLLIIQRWRSTNFRPTDPDSLLILTFTDIPRGHAQIDLLHLNLPKQDHTGVSKGWPKYYWNPLRA